MADEPTVFGKKATEQIAKTVREVTRRMMLPRGERGRWQFQGGAAIVNTAFALITESGEHDEFQSVTLKRSASPATFTTSSCGDMDFDNMEFDLCESMGSATVLVPAGYKAGEALLVKFNVCASEHAWDGWCVVAGPTMRCAVEIPDDPECCPTTQLIKMTTRTPIWFFGGSGTVIEDPCP